jgi:hypothetical protein
MVLDISFSVNKKNPIKTVPAAPSLRLGDNSMKRHQVKTAYNGGRNSGNGKHEKPSDKRGCIDKNCGSL